ncbi:MAG TPA: phosphotransferase family protein [Kofleriaceae bacterium]|nr:phosphotransferase family protein [Kofleriaceae bacterium]
MTAALTDEPRAVRAGETLDTGALGEYLRQALGTGGQVEVEQFPGGHSNLTYLLRFAGNEYVLRRPPFGANIKTAHDMSREYRVLSALSAVYDKAPRPVLFCDDEAVIGAKLYLMERMRGVILRKALPAGLSVDARTARGICEGLIETMVELHALDVDAIGLGDFGKPAGFIERQVSGWTRRYEAACTDDIGAVSRVARWLADTMPEDGRPSLIHNDFKLDNLVLDPDDLCRVIGILDWEMATTGDSLMDLGSSLGYWVEAGDPEPMHVIRFGPTHLPGMMTRAEVAARYGEASGRDVSRALWFYCFGLFKTAVIAQQIYARYARGDTRDERFARMIHGVRLLADKAEATIAKGAL